MNALKTKVMQAASVAAEEFVAQNFRRESFGSKRWKARKKKDSGRRLLTKTGTLRRSLNFSTRGNRVVISSPVAYANIHNQGGTIQHPGGTPYITTGKASRARGARARLRNFGTKRVQFLKKDGSYPAGVRFTEPHPIPIPKRQFIGDSPRLRALLRREIQATLRKHIKEEIKKGLK